MMSIKGELSVGLVIALVIGLIVLILLMTILVTRFDLFSKSSESAQTGVQANLCSGKGRCLGNAADCKAPSTVITAPVSGWTDCAGTCCG